MKFKKLATSAALWLYLGNLGLTYAFSFNETFSAIWGNPTPSQTIFLPVGFHFGKNHNLNNEQWLVALSIRGFIGGTFVNSSNRRVYFAGVEREFYKNGRLSVNYLAGVMQGYKGEGLGHLGPVLSHDPGPLLSFTANWSITDHLAIDLATYGVGGLVGISYLF